jgi:hypothetical protein
MSPVVTILQYTLQSVLKIITILKLIPYKKILKLNKSYYYYYYYYFLYL